jgi:hypothetical protein
MLKTISANTHVNQKPRKLKLMRFSCAVLCYFVLFLFDLRPVPNVTGASGLSILACSFGVLIFLEILNLVNTEKLSHW